MTLSRRRAGTIVIGTLLIPLSLGGCEMKCDCDGDDIEDVVDEIGDEAQDTIDKIREKK